MTSPAVKKKVEQLLAVLDKDIRHIEMTLSQLDALRSLLIKRDDAALERLLGEIRDRAETDAANQQTRQMIRADLARAIGCGDDPLTLSKLQAALSEDQQAAVAARQERLKSLIVELNRQYTLTAVLVSDCSRFNRMLLRTFLGQSGHSGVVYSPNGASRQQISTAVMNLQL
jgi:hypothetical protein